ncbi:MAG: 3'-5' exonuclease [Saprospiraceae bacterium]|nr:3'-5' exonuclease [Bacteroidia bacterium]NNL93775.1 3'-5' exonuclease [Saprospiraceae bacterium]
MRITVKNITQILFIDIETVAIVNSFAELNDTAQKLWKAKANKWINNPFYAGDVQYDFSYKSKAGILAEFAKVVCISIGYVETGNNQVTAVKTKSFFHENEKDLLNMFKHFLENDFADTGMMFVSGHNIKEFDIPFICRRMIINEIALPDILDLSGKKPWQIDHLFDTLVAWKFGDYKNYTSLDLLCFAMDIPSPKKSMHGEDVHDAYWQNKDYKSICDYCENDVISVARLVAKLSKIKLHINCKYESRTDVDFPAF